MILTGRKQDTYGVKTRYLILDNIRRGDEGIISVTSMLLKVSFLTIFAKIVSFFMHYFAVISVIKIESEGERFRGKAVKGEPLCQPLALNTC